MNAVVTSNQDHTAPARPRRTRPLVLRGLTLIAGLAAAVGLFSTAARADVNTTTNGYGWASISNCIVYSGDYANSAQYAIGDTTVRCGSYHNIWTYTQLYRNGALIANSTYPYQYNASTSYVRDVMTTAIHCGGTALWQTISYVIVDGGSWQTVPGPVEKWAPSC